MPADALLRIIGLAARAGAVAAGTERVREDARAGRLRFVLIAADVSANTREKLVPLLEARGIRYRFHGTRDELGGAIGRAPVSAVGFRDASFASRAMELSKEWSEGGPVGTA